MDHRKSNETPPKTQEQRRQTQKHKHLRTHPLSSHVRFPFADIFATWSFEKYVERRNGGGLIG
jgi:hypothetical protein